jgi:hypothetical protein
MNVEDLCEKDPPDFDRPLHLRCLVCGHAWEDALTMMFIEIGTSFGYEPNPIHFCPACQSTNNEEIKDDDAGPELR